MAGKGIRHWMAFLMAWMLQAHNVLAFGKAPFTRGQWVKAWVGRHMWRKRHHSPMRYGRAAWRKGDNPVYAYMRVYDERVNEWYGLLAANPIRGHGHYAMTESGIIFRGCDHTGPAKWAKWRNRYHRPATTGKYFKYSHGHDYSSSHLLVTTCNPLVQYQFMHRETGEYLRLVDIHPWPVHRLADLAPDSLWAERMLDKLVQLNC